MDRESALAARGAPLAVRSDLHSHAPGLAGGLNALVADLFSLYVKTKNFHWHVTGPSFRDYHRLLDEQAGEIFAGIDPLAERVRKLGAATLHSIGDILRRTRLLDNDAAYVTPSDMLAELREDNRQLLAAMRELHGLCDEARDYATGSLLDGLIDEAERRVWFLFETTRAAVS